MTSNKEFLRQVDVLSSDMERVRMKNYGMPFDEFDRLAKRISEKNIMDDDAMILIGKVFDGRVLK